MTLREEHSFVEIFYNFEQALNFTLDWIEENFDPDREFIDTQEIVLMDSGAYRAGVILKNKQLDFNLVVSDDVPLFGSSEDA